MSQKVDTEFIEKWLAKCNVLYESLLEQAERQTKRGNPERALRLIRFAARFATNLHTGRYADGRIENIALEIGKKLDRICTRELSFPLDIEFTKADEISCKKILHVATTVYTVGGHTRLIENWMRGQMEARHSLVLTEQEEIEVPAFIQEAARISGGRMINLPNRVSLIEKSKLLREIANTDADFIVLHTHPDDVIPIVAFATEECPPIALMNHADHVFWLGVSIADLVINLRDYAVNLSERRRFARQNLLLPIPLAIPPTHQTRDKARQQLGISSEETMLLSIGSAYKYKPNDTHNFFTTINKILNQNPSANIYLIGPEPEDYFEYVEESCHNRVHLLGPQDDIYLYKLAADIYLEGFPIASFTALLEAAAMGVCPVMMYAPIQELKVSELAGLKGILNNPNDEEEYIIRVSHLIQNPIERCRIGQQVKEQVIAYHTGKGWRAFLDKIISFLCNARHNPIPIPISVCMNAREDINLIKMNNPCIETRSLLLHACWNYYSKLDLIDIIDLWRVSLETRDASLFSKQTLAWGATVKSKLMDSMHAERLSQH